MKIQSWRVPILLFVEAVIIELLLVLPASEMNADGSNQVYTGIDGFAARWSADGTTFIYVNIPNNNGGVLNGTDVWTCRVNGTNAQQLTNTTGDEWYPSWSPDGNRIVFGYTSDESYENNEVLVMNADGSNVRRITNSPSGITAINPVWMPIVP